MITTLLIIGLILFTLGIFLLVAHNISKPLKSIGVIIIYVGFLLSMIMNGFCLEKLTSINDLNGKFVYEKQYVIDKNGVVQDSIYVKIKPNKTEKK